MTEEERVAGRRQIAIWQETAVELDRLKWQELRELTEAKAAEYFISLDTGDVEVWRSPERQDGSGLVEQQRWFMKAHESRRSS